MNFSPPVLFYVAKTYVYVFICFYITMHGITKFFTFSVFGHQDIVSKVCRVPDSAGMPVGFSVTLFLIVSVHCFYVSTAKWDTLPPFCILLLDLFTFFFLFYLCSALCEAFSRMGYTSYEALTVRSWFRCILQMFIDQPSGMLAKTDAERTVGKCSHFPNVCSNDSILQNWQTFWANYKMYFCLYSFTFT